MSNNEIVPSSPGHEFDLTEAEKLLNTYNEDKDFDLVETNLKKYLEDMGKHVETLGNLADQSQAARTYEVLHNFYKVMTETNEKLINTKKMKNEILTAEAIRKNPQGSVTNHNNLFVGSTAELQRFLIEKNKPNE